jgi:hypothetical protein
MRQVKIWPVLVGLALLGAAALIWSMPRGAGLDYDSPFYLTAAENLRNGRGLYWEGEGGQLFPLLHYPPLYSMVLAFLISMGLDSVSAAACVNIACFAGTVGLTGWVIYHFTRQAWVSVAGSLTALVSPILIGVHLEALSEPLFLVLLIGSLGLLAEDLRRARTGILITSAAVAGLAYLTRYVGLAVVVTGGWAILADRRRDLGRRLRDTAVFGGASLLPVLVWYVRNWALTRSLANRAIYFHPPTVDSLRLGVFTLTGWLSLDCLPFRGGPVLVLVIGVALALLTGWAWVRSNRPAGEMAAGGDSRRASLEAAAILVLFACAYCGLLLASLSFFDAATKLDNRILSPAYVVVLIAFWLIVASIPRPARMALTGAAAVLVASYLVRSVGLLEEMRLNGRGFNNRQWETSETIAWLRAQPDGGILYTNEPFPVRFLTGRSVYWVPEAFDPVQRRQRPGFEAQMEAMRSRLRQPGSVLALFTARLASPEFPSEAEITEGLVVLAQTSDGVIYVDPGNLPLLEQAQVGLLGNTMTRPHGPACSCVSMGHASVLLRKRPSLAWSLSSDVPASGGWLAVRLFSGAFPSADVSGIG